MAKDVKIRVSETGAEKVSSSLNKVDSSMKNMAVSALKMATAYFSAQGVINGFKFAVNAAGVQEAAEKKLATALGKTSDKLLSYASALQQQTTYGDEATIAAMSQLAAFTKNEDEIKLLTKATQDMATALGMDLNSAAQLVGKSFGSSTNALARYGVNVDGAAGSSERLQQLTKGISDLWGGQAAAAADTMSGSIQQMKNALGDIAEVIGGILSPKIREFTQKIKEMAEFAQMQLATADIFESINSGVVSLEQSMRILLQRIGDYNNMSEQQKLSANRIIQQYEILGTTAKNLKNMYDSGYISFDKYNELMIANSQTLKGLKEDMILLMTSLGATYTPLQEVNIEFGNFIIAGISASDTVMTFVEAMGNVPVATQLSLDAILGWREGTESAISSMSSSLGGLSSAFTNFYTNRKAQQLADLRNSKAYLEADAEQRQSMEQRIEESSAQSAIVAFRIQQASNLASIAMNTATAYVRALASPGGLILANVIAGLGAAQAALVISTPPPAYETGGIVPGTSYSGDNIPARVNSGEMILNQQQQKNLFTMANNGGGGGINITVQGNLVASEEEADRFAELIAKRSRQGFNNIAVN